MAQSINAKMIFLEFPRGFRAYSELKGLILLDPKWLLYFGCLTAQILNWWFLTHWLLYAGFVRPILVLPERKFVSVEKNKHSSSLRTFEPEVYYQTIQRSSCQHRWEIYRCAAKTCPCPRPLHTSCVFAPHSWARTTSLRVPPTPGVVLPVVVFVSGVY